MVPEGGRGRPPAGLLCCGPPQGGVCLGRWTLPVRACGIGGGAEGRGEVQGFPTPSLLLSTALVRLWIPPPPLEWWDSEGRPGTDGLGAAAALGPETRAWSDEERQDQRKPGVAGD
ncbi:hypothetical protein NDU88_006273 [Pleurodeles waltl]|uniref:Uncharacterized protein n=1 Tax=Pleurodeles waltl TaxID=8319 RepID=A0AAV7WDY2_PLEWA|nr:hypothetical protein NDU88_006273 [Pleurodeles waltl]